MFCACVAHGYWHFPPQAAKTCHENFRVPSQDFELVPRCLTIILSYHSNKYVVLRRFVCHVCCNRVWGEVLWTHLWIHRMNIVIPSILCFALLDEIENKVPLVYMVVWWRYSHGIVVTYHHASIIHQISFCASMFSSFQQGFSQSIYIIYIHVYIYMCIYIYIRLHWNYIERCFSLWTGTSVRRVE